MSFQPGERNHVEAQNGRDSKKTTETTPESLADPVRIGLL
jgi:hypothetical protein